MITSTLRGTGDLRHDIDTTLKHRARLSRRLKRHGMIAEYGSLDVGSGGNPHLHLLVYSPYIDREALRLWQCGLTCDVPGCDHAQDNERCTGSWGIDIREAYSPDEGLKYAVASDGDPDLRLAVYLFSKGRHRVETYGLARPALYPDAELDERDKRVEAGFCPDCGQELVTVAVGVRRWDHYDWIWLDCEKFVAKNMS